MINTQPATAVSDFISPQAVTWYHFAASLAAIYGQAFVSDIFRVQC